MRSPRALPSQPAALTTCAVCAGGVVSCTLYTFLLLLSCCSLSGAAGSALTSLSFHAGRLPLQADHRRAEYERRNRSRALTYSQKAATRMVSRCSFAEPLQLAEGMLSALGVLGAGLSAAAPAYILCMLLHTDYAL